VDTVQRQHLVRRLFLAEGVTRTGDAVTLVALPLTAVLVLDASAGELALIGLAQALPILALSIPAGAWVDRRPRRWPILIVADIGRAGLLAVVPITAALGVLSLPLLVAVAFLMSAAGTLFDLAFAGWVPRLLRGDLLHEANARIELSRSAALVTGPALGGALVAALTAPVALLGDAASYIGSALLIGSARGAEPRMDPDPTPRHVRQDLTAGAAFLARQPLVAAVVATAATNNLFRYVAMAVAVLYLVTTGGVDPAGVGLAFALGNSGFVVGALIARRLTRRLGVGRTMQVGVALFGPSMLLFALAPPAMAGAAFSVMVFAHGLGIAIHNVNQVTVRQVLTPDRLRARVTAVMRLLVFGAIPVGTLIGGVIGELEGIRTALVVSGVGLLAGSLPYFLVHIGRLRAITDLIPADPSGADPLLTPARGVHGP
jgi:MFS family permease